MAAGPVHKERFKKNLLTLAMVLGLVGLIWAITIFRMS